jgi:hypothetical protein
MKRKKSDPLNAMRERERDGSKTKSKRKSHCYDSEWKA